MAPPLCAAATVCADDSACEATLSRQQHGLLSVVVAVPVALSLVVPLLSHRLEAAARKSLACDAARVSGGGLLRCTSNGMLTVLVVFIVIIVFVVFILLTVVVVHIVFIVFIVFIVLFVFI